MNVNIYVNEKFIVKLTSNLLSKLKNRNDVNVHINLNVSSLTLMLMINFPTSN